MGVINYKTRAVQCIAAAPSSSGVTLVVDTAFCANSSAPSLVSQCEDVQCKGLYWQSSDAWSPCSNACISDPNNGSSYGVSEALAPTCMMVAPNGTSVAASAALCLAALPVSVPRTLMPHGTTAFYLLCVYSDHRGG